MPYKSKPFCPTSDKIVTAKKLVAKLATARRAKKKIVFTNGCYDLLHVGHVTLLEKSRACGDILVVAINSDNSLRGLKGTGRPVTLQKDRAKVLAALSCVDYVVAFGTPTPYKLIQTVKPDVLIKGADWKLKDIVGKDVLDAYGGKVVRLPLIKGYSTTSLIQRICSGKSALES